jgi:SulP family sulfate permease
MTAERILAVMPDAFAFALLGAIESLLSATVADGMTGRRHRSNCELVAQGAANIASSLWGGIVVTGTVARTATNVRAGAHGPAAGMLHSVFLLAFLLAAAPLAAFIPLCALAGVLAVVAWRMLAPRAIASLARASRGDAAAVFATLLLTVFRDLTQGIIAGVAVASLAFMQRMSASAGIAEALVAPDAGDGPPESRTIYEPSGLAAIGVYRVRGALFFGSAASLSAALGRIIAGRRALILDFSEATLVDSTGADAVRSFVETARRKGVRVRIAGARPDLSAMLAAHGVAGNTAFDADIGASLGVLRDVEGSARG